MPLILECPECMGTEHRRVSWKFGPGRATGEYVCGTCGMGITLTIQGEATGENQNEG